MKTPLNPKPSSPPTHTKPSLMMTRIYLFTMFYIPYIIIFEENGAGKKYHTFVSLFSMFSTMFMPIFCTT